MSYELNVNNIAADDKWAGNNTNIVVPSPKLLENLALLTTSTGKSYTFIVIQPCLAATLQPPSSGASGSTGYTAQPRDKIPPPKPNVYHFKGEPTNYIPESRDKIPPPKPNVYHFKGETTNYIPESRDKIPPPKPDVYHSKGEPTDYIPQPRDEDQPTVATQRMTTRISCESEVYPLGVGDVFEYNINGIVDKWVEASDLKDKENLEDIYLLHPAAGLVSMWKPGFRSGLSAINSG